MKIYIGHSREFDFKNDLYQPIRNSRLNSEHEIIFPHENYSDASDFVTKDIIKTCDVMIAEVSYPATGLGIELGWANSFECPIICISRKGQKISNSLKVVCDKFYEYTDRNDIAEVIENAIENMG